jgi:aminopeptidase N
MLESISWEKFKLGVSNYLKQFEYMNAKTLDLWQAIQKEIKGVDIIRLMRTWTEQMGLPIINVLRTGNNLTFTQERYLLDKDAQFCKNSSHFQ